MPAPRFFNRASRVFGSNLHSFADGGRMKPLASECRSTSTKLRFGLGTRFKSSFLWPHCSRSFNVKRRTVVQSARRAAGLRAEVPSRIGEFDANE
jgi:hypothetical protein